LQKALVLRYHQPIEKSVNKYTKDIVLVMYQLTDPKNLKWDGNPIWMPNIKLPNDFIFYKTE
jgi:hypothetical protein